MPSSLSLLHRGLLLLSQPRVAAGVTAFVAVIVAVATLTPAEHMPSAPGGDKLHHFLAFAALAFPLSFAVPRACLWVVLGATAFGGMIEIIQPYVNRYGDVRDAIANGLGAVGGAALGVLAHRLMRWREPSTER